MRSPTQFCLFSFSLVAILGPALGTRIQFQEEQSINGTIGNGDLNPPRLPELYPNYNAWIINPGAYFAHMSPNLYIGDVGQALIPELIPPPGFVYEFKNKEKTRLAQAFFRSIDTNEYKWEIDEVKSLVNGYKMDINQKFAKLVGKWQSNLIGHKSVHVYNAAGQEMFKIRASKHTLNPFQMRQSFRILPPGSKSNDDAMFTIIKDFIGKGFLWMKEEWRVYRGRKRDRDMIYYGIGSYMGWDFKFYRNKALYDHGERRVVAKIEQKINAGAIIEHEFLPDKFKLKVYPGEDSALLLAVSTIIDMVHDSQQNQGIDID